MWGIHLWPVDSQHKGTSNAQIVSTLMTSSCLCFILLWLCYKSLMDPCHIFTRTRQGCLTVTSGIMMTSWNGNIFALLALCAGNSPVPGEFSAQRPVTRSFNVFFYLRLNKRLSKQSWDWWFETPSRPLWRHRNEFRRVLVNQTGTKPQRNSNRVHISL